MDQSTAPSAQPRSVVRSLPVRFWLGLIITAIWWTIAWLQWRPFSDNYFFPLWSGFILTVDGLVMARTGTSLLQRAGWRVLILFILSVPLWWLFEAFNLVLNNWNYHLPEQYSQVSYALRASLAFSTVIPAVFVATELVRSFRLNALRGLPPMALTDRTLLLLHLAGWLMLAAVLAVPDYTFPLVWLSVFFLVDPIATWVGGPSIGSYLRKGDWSPVFNVALGTVLCGLFWELWNYYAMPQWTYSIPYFEFGHIFEMPVLGYGGYIPFGLEIYAIVALGSGLFPALRIPLPVASDVATR